MAKSIWDVLDAVLQPAVNAYDNLRGICPAGSTYNTATKKCVPNATTNSGIFGGLFPPTGTTGVGSGGTGTGTTIPALPFEPVATATPAKKFPTALVVGVLVLGTAGFFIIKKLKKK